VDGRCSIEVSLWVTGLSLLAAYAAARAWSTHASNQGIVAMREARAVEAAASSRCQDIRRGGSYSRAAA
jgi:hypothetical protein